MKYLDDLVKLIQCNIFLISKPICKGKKCEKGEKKDQNQQTASGIAKSTSPEIKTIVAGGL